MQGFKPIRHCDERSEEAIQEKNIQNKFANCNAGKILNQVQDDKYFGLRCKDDRKKSKRKGNVISWIASLSLTMTPFGTFRDGNVLKKKAAFTLAEVLITLGIIGVVAALTLPGLLAEYSKLVVETKLKKFYSQINQAIQLSEAEYGAKEYWYSGSNSVETDADGNPVPGSSTAEKWFMKYIGSHMTVIKVEYDELARPTYFFKDGTALKQMNGSMQTSQEGSFRDWTFYTAYPDRCLELYGSEENARGKCAWPFLFVPVSPNPLMDYDYKYVLGKGFEPYKWNWYGDIQTLKDKCKGSNPEYCTAWIQMNGWKIPDDYPYKVSY